MKGMDGRKLECKKRGDYLLPDIKLLYEEDIRLGKYGRLRREYLQKTPRFCTVIWFLLSSYFRTYGKLKK